MELLNINYDDFESFLFVLFRVAAFIVFAPILGSRQFPVLAKIGFILLLSLTVYPLVKPLLPEPPRGMFELTMYLTIELLIGIAIAFASRLIFSAVQIGGTMVDFQMGFGVVNVIDPQTETQVSITAQFQNIFAILIYLSVNAHHTTILAVVESFQLINIQAFHLDGTAINIIVKLFIDTFIVGIKIASPIMAILFFISVGLGLVARTVPQMNVFIVGFPLQIGAGLFMIGLSMSFFGMVIKNHLAHLPVELTAILRAF